MRLASLVLLPAFVASAVTTGCIIVIEDDDDDGPSPWPVPDAGVRDGGGYPDARRVDAGMLDGGSPLILQVDVACRPAPELSPQTLSIQGDLAVIEVEHGGGCGTHQYRVCWDEIFRESFPVQASLSVLHNSDDPCDAIVRERLTIDLTRLREAYRQRYQTRTGSILIDFVSGPGGRYEF